MSEVSMARESSVRSVNAMGRARKPNVPKSDRGFYDDSFVTVYNESGQVVERGEWDYSMYRDEPTKWNAKDGNYDLPRGYKLVIRNG